MASSRAFGLGPLETIVNVGWGLPVYVIVWCSAARLGASEPHLATVTLSAAAIKKKCEIVLETSSTLGSPYYVYLKLVVIKVPGPIPDVLFTLVTSGTQQSTDLPAPEGFCGTYTSTSSTTDMGTFVVPGADPLHGFPDIVMHRFHIHNEYTDPDGTTEVDYNLDIVEDLLDEYKLGNPNFHVGTDTFTAEYWSYYDEDGNLHNLGIPCDDPPTTQVDYYPFDIEVVVNPQKDHTVQNPNVIGDVFLSPGSAVTKTPAIMYSGDKTSIWESFLGYGLTQHFNGITNMTVDFKIQKNLFAIQRKEKIIEVFPSTAVFGFSNLTYSGSFRLNKGTPSPFIYDNNWAGTPPDFNDGITLYAGAPPPPVTWTPYNIPF